MTPEIIDFFLFSEKWKKSIAIEIFRCVEKLDK